MMKTDKKQPLSPRRRVGLVRSGGVSKALTRALPRPGSAATASSPSCNIRVVVRVRPSNDKEQEQNYHNVVNVVDDQMLVFDPKDEEAHFFYHGVQQKRRDLLKKPKKDLTFRFDKVFNTETTNVEVFMNSTQNLIENLMEGSNCSVFAYGATGAGKTFTMIGNTSNPGITYLTIRDLFKRTEELRDERDFELMVTYIEVYNELVKDLLNPGAPLNLLEDAKYGVVISGVKVQKIHNPEELFSLLDQGNKQRTQHPTDANAESSRSHAVFQVYIRMTKKITSEVMHAKLSMIDLAGSERGSATGFVGARFKEGANINKSLLALGNCINSLADGQKHVPYRDSKLTRLLKDSLGGNCYTIMIANVSPSSMSFEDTYNTLKYATRAKKIQSNVKRNVVRVDMNVDQYLKLVEDLRTENAMLKTEVAKLKAVIEQMSTDKDCQKSDSTDTENKDPIEHTTVIIQEAGPTLAQLEQLEKEKNELQKQLDQLQISRTKDSTEPVKNITDDLLKTFGELKFDMTQLLKREHELKSVELGMTLRRGLKMEIEPRLSVFYVDTPSKDETRGKLNDQIRRYEKRTATAQFAMEQNKVKIEAVDQTIRRLVRAHPELEEEVKQFDLDLERIKHRYEKELLQHEKSIVMDDYRDKCNLIENLASLAAPLFMAVGGKDDAPDYIKKKYEQLVAAFEGKKHLKWSDNEDLPTELDSGLSSATSIPEDTNRAVKRKIESDSQLSLNSTFTMGSDAALPSAEKEAGPAVNAAMVLKESNATGAKRLAKTHSPKPRFPITSKVTSKQRRQTPVKNNYNRKDNGQILRAETAKISAIRKKTPVKGISDRPRFKM